MSLPGLWIALPADQVIRFWRTRDNYGGFSNFAPYPVEIDGKTWKTSEHYYQAMKFTDPVTQQRIFDAATPRKAADLGRGIAGIRPDWDEVKLFMMWKVLHYKFKQHVKLLVPLVESEDKWIVEDSPHDYYWGAGKDDTGQNYLGQILMLLRGNIRGGVQEKVNKAHEETIEEFNNKLGV